MRNLFTDLLTRINSQHFLHHRTSRWGRVMARSERKMSGVVIKAGVVRSAAAGDEKTNLDNTLSQNGTVALRGDFDATMKAQADALSELSSKVLATGARDGLAQALAKVEARLSVNEQTVAALEQRMGEKIASLDAGTNSIADRLHGLRQRLEKFEEKQTNALAELRLEVFNLAHPKVGEAKINPAPEPFEAIAAPVLVPIQDRLAQAAQEDEVVARAITYLDTARKAAIEAGEKATTAIVKPKSAAALFWRKRRWPVLAVAALLVVWFDAYVFAHYQPAEGAVTVAGEDEPHKPSPRAELIRGLKYLKAVPADPALARRHIEKAAAGRDAVAQMLMGQFYQSGDNGVAADMKNAAGWYERAAATGNLKAMTNLAKLYAGGWPEGTNFAKAAQWFSRAAAYGDVDAAFDLAILYERGLGVARDAAEAYKWYGIAAANGDNHAASRASALSGHFSPARQQELNVTIAAFKPMALNPAVNDMP